MKRLIVLTLAAALLLAGCARRPDASDSVPPEPLILVGVCQVGAESDWRVANSESMKAVFTEENGYQLLFQDAQQKQENQFVALRRFIQQQVDYIVLMPIMETGWDSVLEEAREADIPVILVDRMVEVEDETLYATHIGSDFYQEGQTAVDWMEERFGEQPVSVVHIQGTMGSTAQEGRTAALEEALAEHEDSWTLLARLDGDFTQAKSYEVMTGYLTENPGQPIDVVYCENDNEAFGAIQALEEQGYTCGEGGVAVISFDATRHALQLCQQGKIALAVECNPLLGPLTEQAIRELEAGGTPAHQQYVEERWFTPEDVTDELLAARAY